MPSHAYYSSNIHKFIETSTSEIIGVLTRASDFCVDIAQRDAWVDQIDILKNTLKGLDGELFLEFNVPRIGSRIDAVVIAGSVIFPIEFKVGESSFKSNDINQVLDYALDLKNFHKGSHSAPIIPILVATQATQRIDTELTTPYDDLVFRPLRSNVDGLRHLIIQGLGCTTGLPIDTHAWESAPYEPTPTIIEAAQALYAQHSVDAITRREASARNLKVTSLRVERIIEDARQGNYKAIVFVTGVPGAGKTLVGLNVATKKGDKEKPNHAVFLSGNGPLVKVLHEALTRDEVSRQKKLNKKVFKGNVAQEVKAFIQNVHHFRDAGIRDPNAPWDHVVIFDEAQRAWNHKMTIDFMHRKKKQKGFTQSEPEFLISYLDRHEDWAVVICLVGGGQEINRGEAGISAWLDAILTQFPSWRVYVSPELTDSEYAAGHVLDKLKGRPHMEWDHDLHLAVSMRSFRAENVSSFVKAVLDCDRQAAEAALGKMKSRYPIAITRDLNKAKEWVRKHARGSERFGLVASSNAQRLKPHAIDVRVEINPIHWFLNDANDTRSSFYMEDAATEFQVQGLELDWICVTWDADLRFSNSSSGWNFHSFVGSKWTSIHNEDRQQYLRNAYRVLLTRARQGMVIFIPPGDKSDPTRTPAYYDSTFEYLSGIGISNLDK